MEMDNFCRPHSANVKRPLPQAYPLPPQALRLSSLQGIERSARVELSLPQAYPLPPQASPLPPQEDVEHHSVVVTEEASRKLGPLPTSTTCSTCHAEVVTTVKTEATRKTHLFALLLCLFGCWPCCFIPYFVDSCQSPNHYCPHCRAYLGKYDN